MDPLWRTALWQQFGATIDMLENALLACPSTHWKGSIEVESTPGRGSTFTLKLPMTIEVD